jgi:uncharacterized RDD family membrane protein YckC
MAAAQVPYPAASGPPIVGTAGIVSRGLAAAVDAAVIVGLVVAAYAIQVGALFLYDPRGFVVPDTSLSWFIDVGLVVAFGYLTLSWAVIGRTRGDRVMGLRVVTKDGSPPALWRSAVRALLYLIFPLGLFWAAVSSRQRSVQDLLVGTRVIHDWR